MLRSREQDLIKKYRNLIIINTKSFPLGWGVKKFTIYTTCMSNLVIISPVILEKKMLLKPMTNNAK